MNHVVASLGSYPIALSTLVATLALLGGAAILIYLCNRALKHWLQPVGARMGLRPETMRAVARSVTSFTWFVALLLVLDLWGVSVGGLWALLASAAAVVGVGFLATWAMVSNVTASVFLAIWRPFHLGDTVVLLPENLKGRAVDRNLMFTVLREEGGAILQVPNNLFFQKIFRVGDG